MTHKQRLLAAIRREEVDRIPHATYNIHPYYPTSHSQDPSYSEILAQIRATAGAAVKVSGARVGIGLSRPQKGICETFTAEEGDGTTVTIVVHAPRGDLVSEVRVPRNQPGLVTKHFIRSDEDIENYLSLPYQPPDLDVTQLRERCEAIGENGIVLVGFSDPMYATASLFDFEDFCVRCATDMPSIKRMVDWAFERSIENAKIVCRSCEGMDCILHTSGPELCTPPMFSPEVFAQLVTPYMKKIIAVIHKHNLLAAIHCHGRVRGVFGEIIKTGADLLEPIEPPEQGDISLEELLEQAEGKISLMGHVQDQAFYLASPGSLTRWVEQIARTARGRTGYIMSPTCTPFEHPCSDTYKANYLEWLRAAEESSEFHCRHSFVHFGVG